MIVGSSYERCKTKSVLLGSTKNRTTIHLIQRQDLLQSRPLATRIDINLVEIHQQTIRQSHIPIELVVDVEVIEIKTTQKRRQKATHKGGLSASLRTYKHRYAFVAVKHILLLPMGHHRSEPDGQIIVHLRAEAWNAIQQLAYVVLTIPLRQIVQEICNWVVDYDFG